MISRSWQASIAAGAFAAGIACSVPPAEDRAAYDAPPRDTFQPVGDALGSNCGSLDCHGHPARNLRLYSFNGLRLEGVPGIGVTSPVEYDATYDSVVAIDPEVLGTVVDEGGDRPERWIVVSKGRGTEAHKGHAAMAPDGPADRCLISWISGALDAEACATASDLIPPEPIPPEPP